jgi:16S rRNA (cytosine1402-N4)-methyltransferase
MKKKTDSIPGKSTNGYHIPVLLQEVLDGLAIKPTGIYVDCTFGGGGHSAAILQKLDSDSRLVAFDQDGDVKNNIPMDERVLFIPQNFRHIARFLKLHKIEKVDGVLADLGVSSHQFDEAARGFSTRFDAGLDMRMDQRQTLKASDIISQYTEWQLHKLFEKYGEVTNAKTLAGIIVQQRMIAAIKTINDFKQVIHAAVKGNPQKYFAQVFQALRIEVNDELGALKDLLEQLPGILKPGGRIAIITFHSIEDRLVKNYFRSGTFSVAEEDEVYGTKTKTPFRILTKKPITATPEEQAQNPRARSAKLRIAEWKK